VCRIAREAIGIIEALHATGIVHCDIKPDNFLLNQVSVGGFVLVDFGLSMFWRSERTHLHVENTTTAGFRGTLRYGSANIHKLCRPTRRDDVASWFYSIVEIAKGKLPWKDVQDSHLCMSCKQATTTEKLCAGLPAQMQTIWNAIKRLEFEEQPNYAFIKAELDTIIADNGWPADSEYDWEIRPQMIYQLTPFPELFERNMMEAQARSASARSKKKRCLVA
jgi:serine/threonine protein kinase